MPEITYGRWNPTEVWDRVLDGTWVSAEELGGMVLVTPTSIASTGTGNSSSIGANGSVTFSSCASLSLNGVFSATYDNYMINMRAVNNTSNGFIYFFYRVGGVNNTNPVYGTQYLTFNGTSIGGGRATGDASGPFLPAAANSPAGATHYIYGPYLAQPTASRMVDASSVNTTQMYNATVIHRDSTSFDGITFYRDSDTFTGLVSVYGLVGA